MLGIIFRPVVNYRWVGKKVELVPRDVEEGIERGRGKPGKGRGESWKGHGDGD